MGVTNQVLSIFEQSLITGIPFLFFLIRRYGFRKIIYPFSASLFALILQPNFLILGLEKIHHGNVLFRKKMENNMRPLVGLTIDDCPSVDRKSGISYSSLTEIVNILHEYNATATLFIMSNTVNVSTKALLRKAILQGNELGNHHSKDEISFKLLKSDYIHKFLKTDRLISEIYSNVSKRPPKWFRPGAGIITPWQAKSVQSHGYKVILGSIILPDPIIRIPRFNAFLLRLRTKRGKIIIIHDRPWTPETLRRALPDLKKRFRLVSLSKLMK